MLILSFFIFFLFGSFFLTCFTTSFFRIEKIKSKKEINKRTFFFFSYILEKAFPKKTENLLFILQFTKYATIILYSLLGFLYLLNFLPWIISFSLIFFLSLIIDYLFRVLGVLFPEFFFYFSSIFTSFYLLLFFPLTGIFLKIMLVIYKKAKIENVPEKYFLLKEKMLELLQESGFMKFLDFHDRKILSSFLNFREKVAREIMVPRVDLFSIPSDMTIKNVATLLMEEDYSRIPVYKESVDQVIGILLYKDLLKIYAKQNEKLLEEPIETLIKPVLYAPENKKISLLFQEFKTKQMHIAIIVNEYGGTEGIVTIEDILEELVGEIEDEYDIEEEKQYKKLPSGAWIVDAKMSIIDIEKKLNIHIPHSPEYETLGGYIFHCAGTIPTKGWKLHHDEYDIEVLDSNERCVEKIKIIPLNQEK